MRNMLHELKRAIKSALRSLLDQDDHTRHAEDTTTHSTVWRIIHHNNHSTYIPLPPGRHRSGTGDTIDLTDLLTDLADRAQREGAQRLALCTADAQRRAHLASLALTSHTLHNADTTTFPRILA